ncbi:MAG TPA: hypothetical protein PKA64_07820 [Myxococcota bacterium]|nr:hypothetical protein [Myxococcota bacterium]
MIVTYDPSVSNEMWLMRDDFPELAAMDAAIFPPPLQVAAWLGGDVTITPVPIPRDTPDWHLGSFWAHPERVLDRAARDARSSFARARPEVVERVVRDVARDLTDGAWDARYGALRALDADDGGLRLIVAR